MSGPIEATETSFAAGGVNHARICRAGNNFMNVHVGQSLVGRLPTVAAVVADQHAADLDACVQSRGRNRIIGEITSARLKLWTGRKICIGAVLSNLFQFLPTTVLTAVNRGRNRPDHHTTVQGERGQQHHLGSIGLCAAPIFAGGFGIEQSGMLPAGVDLLRILWIHRHAGERPITEIALGLPESFAVLLETVPTGKGCHMKRFLAVRFSHPSLLQHSVFTRYTVLTWSHNKSQGGIRTIGEVLAILIIRSVGFLAASHSRRGIDPYYKFAPALYFCQISISSFDSTISANRSIRLSAALC